MLGASGTCYRRIQTIARDFFVISVENCGSAFLPNYWLVRGDRLTRQLALVDHLSPYMFFAAELRKELSSLSRVRLVFAEQHQRPY